MRAINIFVISILLTIGYCSKLRQAEFEEIKKIEASVYGRELLETLSLQISAQTPLSTILELLNKLDKGLTDDQSSDDTKWAADDKSCKEDKKRLGDIITQAQADEADAAAELLKLGTQKTQLETDIKDKETDIAGKTADKLKLAADRALDLADYNTRNGEYSAVVSALDKVIAKTETLVGSVSGSTGKQLKIAKGQNAITPEEEAHLKTLSLLMQIGKSNPILALATLAAGADQDTTQKLLVALRKLKISVEKSKEALVQHEAEAVTDVKALDLKLAGMIGDLESQKEALQTELDAVNASITEQTTKRDNAKTLFTNTTKELEDRTKQCDALEKKYNEDKTQRTNELGIIDEVRTIFNTKLANMRAYLKTKVENKLD